VKKINERCRKTNVCPSCHASNGSSARTEDRRAVARTLTRGTAGMVRKAGALKLVHERSVGGYALLSPLGTPVRLP
jgi:hypothetical protein